jgi:conjugal transfer pilus assembly protein TraD
MNESTIEALLRPTVEKNVAFACYSCAALVYFEPTLFMLNETVSYGMSAAFCGFGYYRQRQGEVIARYQRNLKRLPSYLLKSSDVPVSTTKIWLGKGFEWTATHTQRLSELRKPYGRKFLEMGKIYDTFRSLERKYEDSPAVLSFLKPFSSQHFLSPLVSSLENKVGENKVIDAIDFLSEKVLPNPWRPLPPVGGEKAIHAVEPDEDEQEIDLDTRTGHTLIQGTTRVGKSRLLEVLVTQAIHRKNKQGDYEGPVVCLDPKGDAELMARLYTESQRAGRKMYIMHLGFPDMSCRYNAIAGSFSRYTEIASRATDSMGGGGDGEAFKAFAWRFANVVAMAQVALGHRPTFETIQRYMLDIEPLFISFVELYLDKHDKPIWRDIVDESEATIKPNHVPRNLTSRRMRTVALVLYLQEKRINDPIVRGLLSSVQYEKSYYDKITASFLPLLEKLTTGRMIELIAPNYDDLEDKRPILDWLKVARQKAVVYVGLDAMTDQTVSDVVGSNMFSDIVSMSGYIYKYGMQATFGDSSKDDVKPIFSIFADEVNELISPKFIPLLNKAGGSGVNVTALTQSAADIPAKLGDETLAKVVVDNFNTLVMMRVKSKATAELLTDQLGEVYINNLTTVSGVNDNSDVNNSIHFTSKNEDRLTTERVPMLEADTIINLPKGQAFALVDGSKLLKLRFPLLKDCKHTLPPSVMQMYDAMTDKYKTSDGWWNPSEFSANSYASSTHHAHEYQSNDMDKDYEAMMEEVNNG